MLFLGFQTVIMLTLSFLVFTFGPPRV